MFPVILQGGKSPSNIIEHEDYISVDDIRIYPKQLIFSDAFECREYAKIITIQNCGKKRGFVRILQPSSYAFKIKTFTRGQYLPPGLKIIRTVSFKYLHHSIVTLANLPIIINKTQIDFKFQVTFSVVSISVTPTEIDFGEINVGNSGVVRTVILKNEGTRGTHFAVDLRYSDLQVDILFIHSSNFLCIFNIFLIKILLNFR